MLLIFIGLVTIEIQVENMNNRIFQYGEDYIYLYLFIFYIYLQIDEKNQKVYNIFPITLQLEHYGVIDFGDTKFSWILYGEGVFNGIPLSSNYGIIMNGYDPLPIFVFADWPRRMRGLENRIGSDRISPLFWKVGNFNECSGVNRCQGVSIYELYIFSPISMTISGIYAPKITP